MRIHLSHSANWTLSLLLNKTPEVGTLSCCICNWTTNFIHYKLSNQITNSLHEQGIRKSQLA